MLLLLQQLQEHDECLVGGTGDDLLALAGQVQALAHHNVAHLCRHPHGAHGLERGAAAWACNAAGGHGAVGVAQLAHSECHLLYYGLAHRATGVEGDAIHPQHSLFHVVAVAHHAAHKVVAAAGNLGDDMCHVAASAALGGGEGVKQRGLTPLFHLLCNLIPPIKSTTHIGPSIGHLVKETGWDKYHIISR